MPEETLDLVNEEDQVIGRAPRSVVEKKGMLYRCAGVYVFLGGKLVLQKRAKKKKIRPGHWSIVEETVQSHESYEEAAVRGVKEELGLQVKTIEGIGKAIIRDKDYNDNFLLKVFAAKAEGKVKAQKKEVDKIKAVMLAEARKIAGKEKSSPGFIATLSMAEEYKW